MRGRRGEGGEERVIASLTINLTVVPTGCSSASHNSTDTDARTVKMFKALQWVKAMSILEEAKEQQESVYSHEYS